MRTGVATGLALAMLASTPAAMAQRDQVVVTGTRIDRDGSDLPVISIRVPAEFVIFTLQVETATRSEDDRAKELEQAYRVLVDRVRRTQGMTLEAGDAYSAIPLETLAVREIIEPDENDSQRSQISLVLTVQVRAGDTFDGIRRRTDQFLQQTTLPGRVEMILDPEQAIGVRDPMKHRETLLRMLAADTELLQSLFGRGAAGPAALSLSGLEGRVQSRPVGPLELELYLRYDLSLMQAPRR